MFKHAGASKPRFGASRRKLGSGKVSARDIMPIDSLTQVLAARTSRPALARRARFRLTALYGRGLYALKLGRVRRVRRAGCTVYIKTRRGYSAALVGAGNAILKLWRGELLGLPEREWLAWEQKLAPLAWPQEIASGVRVRGRSLRCPALGGEPLSTVLRSNRSLQERMEAVRLAAVELIQLQRLELEFPDGGWRLWSHGDAHAGNVIVDLERQGASWFDFETVHAGWCSPTWRHADDLRALAYSCAACCCPCEYSELARVIVAAASCPRLRAELGKHSRRLQSRAQAFHLAQAPLGWAEHQGFGRVLQAALENVGAAEN